MRRKESNLGKKMSDELTEMDYGTLGLALGKCLLLQEWIPKNRDYSLCVLTKENTNKAAQNGHILAVLPFGFPEMTDEEKIELMGKLEHGEKLAWLKNQPKEF
jgi:hypothetical protein